MERQAWWRAMVPNWSETPEPGEDNRAWKRRVHANKLIFKLRTSRAPQRGIQIPVNLSKTAYIDRQYGLGTNNRKMNKARRRRAENGWPDLNHQIKH